MKIKANHQLRVLLAILLISLAVMSCATSNKIVERDISAETSNVGLPSDVPVNVSLIEDKDPEIDLGMSLDPEAEAEIDIVDDAEFCKDNIYAKYLRDQYLQNNKKAQRPESAYKPSKKNHRRRVATRSPYDAREVEALYYARSRLLGDTVPYFGAIPVVTNPRVEHWVRFFKNNGRNSFLKWLVRGESVKNVVLPLLKSEGMPPEFIFLSMVESGFSNSAYSRARATGPWQFMPGTAKLYGLQMNMWVDERRDPAKSTQAAARLLRDLYQEFGDWYLAMAAYNAGPGRIRSAIRRTGSRDFWVLADSAYLPAETKNYVPKVLAALMLANNPQGHGFDVIGDPLDVLPTHQIEIRQPVAVSQISEKLQIPERLLRHWNPEIVNAITPPGKRGSPYLLRIKAELNDQWNRIEDSLAYLEIKDVFSHKIRKGDTLASIAARYRIGIKNLLNYNPGLSSKKLKIGAEVSVPTMFFESKSKSSRSTQQSRKSGSAG